MITRPCIVLYIMHGVSRDHTSVYSSIYSAQCLMITRPYIVLYIVHGVSRDHTSVYSSVYSAQCVS